MPPTRQHSRPSAAVIKRRRLAALGAGAGALVLVAILIVLLTSTSGGTKPPARPHAHALGPRRCPLTDLPAPGGHVPRRPAVAVKIGNEPLGARPQSGLNEADIVFDTPAEGFIMRYVAVYECKGASSIGPTRSVRFVDWHLLQAFGHPILGFAGGIIPDVSAVDKLGWLNAANLLGAAQGAGTRISGRQAPDNLYTSTSALLKQFPKERTPPPPVFSYGGPLPKASTPASSLAINFSTGTDVVWKWDAASASWIHTYAGVTDVDSLDHKPVTTTNIVVQIVGYHYGPFAESPGSTGDVESQTTGSGSGYVLRGGRAIKVTWHRPTTSSPWKFTDAAGKRVTLAPGRTWVELVLNTIAASPGAIKISP